MLRFTGTYEAFSKFMDNDILMYILKQTNLYNKFMGGVDLADNVIANYRIHIKGKKWYWPLFINIISMCVVNSWKIMKIY